MTYKPKLIITNQNAYAPFPGKVSGFRRRFVLEVEAVTDGVPGAFNEPEDLMRWINTNPYVRLVSLDKEDERNGDVS